MNTNPPPFRRIEQPVGRFIVEAQLTKLNGPPRWEVTVYKNHVSRPVIDYWIEPTWNRVQQRLLAIGGQLLVDSFAVD